VMNSDDALLKLLNEQGANSFDLIYIDGSHRAPDVIVDAILGFKLLRSQGVMIFDDYPWKTDAGGSENPLNSPKIAIDAFTTLFAQQLDIVQRVPLFQLVVKKR
jgi:predicted O-methyltransferase YrrM